MIYEYQYNLIKKTGICNQQVSKFNCLPDDYLKNAALQQVVSEYLDCICSTKDFYAYPEKPIANIGERITLISIGGEGWDWYSGRKRIGRGSTFEVTAKAGVNKYSVIIYDCDGCEKEQTVIFFGIKTCEANLNITGQVSACTGETVQLYSDPGFERYEWRGPGLSSSEQNPTFKPTCSAIYSLTTVLDGCTYNDSIYVSVAPCCNHDVEVYGTQFVQLGGTIVLNSSQGDEYIWVAPNGDTFDTMSVGVTAIPSYEGLWKVKTRIDCCDYTNYINVALSDPCTDQKTNVEWTRDVCVGDLIKIYVFGANSATVNGVAATALEDGSFYFETLEEIGAYDYEIVTSVGDCTDTHNIKAVVKQCCEEYTIDVDGTEQVCEGEDIDIYVVHNFPEGSTFNWYKDGAIFVGGVASITIQTGMSGIYTVIGTAPDGCIQSKSFRVGVNQCCFDEVTITGPSFICSGESIELVASREGLWSTGDTSDRITVDTPGTYSITVVDGDCEYTDEVVIGEQTFDPNFSGDLTICDGQSVTWSVDQGSVVWSTGATDNPYTFTPETGSYYVDVTSPDENCVKRIDLEVTVVDNPDTGTVFSQNFEVCDGETIDLNVNVDGGDIGVWSYDGTLPNGITLNPDGTLSVSGLTEDINLTFIKTVGTAPCEATLSLDVVLRVQPNASQDNNFSADVCELGTINLYTILNGDFPGELTGLPGCLTFNETTGDLTDTGCAQGSYSVTYSVSNGACVDTITFNINVIQSADAGTAINANLSACEGDLVDLEGNILGGNSNGIWTGPEGSINGGFVDLTGVSPGTYTFTKTVSTACGTDTVQFDITITELPDAGSDATSSFTVCYDDPPLDIQAVSGGDAGVWQATGLTGLNTSTGVYTPNINDIGTYTITKTVNNTCGADSIQFTLVVECCENTLDPGQDIVICEGDSVTHAQLFGSTIGTISIVNGNGSIDLSGDPIVFNAGSGSSSGSVYTFTNSVGTAPCAAEETATVTVFLIPSAGENVTVEVCENATVNLCNQIGASALGTFTGIPFGTLDGCNFTAILDTSGSYTITHTVGTGSCQDSTQFTLVILDSPQAGTGGNLFLCVGDSGVNLQSQVGGDNGVWTSSPPLTIMNGSGVISAPQASDVGIYTITKTVSTPCGTDTINIILRIGDPYAGVAGPAFEICENTSVDITNQFTDSNFRGNVSYSSNCTGVSITSDGIMSAGLSSAGTCTITVTATENGCIDTETIDVTINNAPNPGNAGPHILCNIAQITNLQPIIGGDGGNWALISKPPNSAGSFAGSSLTIPTTDNPDNIGSYIIRKTVNTSDCGSAAIDVEVYVDPCCEDCENAQLFTQFRCSSNGELLELVLLGNNCQNEVPENFSITPSLPFSNGSGNRWFIDTEDIESGVVYTAVWQGIACGETVTATKTFTQGEGQVSVTANGCNLSGSYSPPFPPPNDRYWILPNGNPTNINSNSLTATMTGTYTYVVRYTGAGGGITCVRQASIFVDCSTEPTCFNNCFGPNVSVVQGADGCTVSGSVDIGGFDISDNPTVNVNPIPGAPLSYSLSAGPNYSGNPSVTVSFSGTVPCANGNIRITMDDGDCSHVCNIPYDCECSQGCIPAVCGSETISTSQSGTSTICNLTYSRTITGPFNLGDVKINGSSVGYTFTQSSGSTTINVNAAINCDTDYVLTITGTSCEDPFTCTSQTIRCNCALCPPPNCGSSTTTQTVDASNTFCGVTYVQNLPNTSSQSDIVSVSFPNANNVQWTFANNTVTVTGDLPCDITSQVTITARVDCDQSQYTCTSDTITCNCNCVAAVACGSRSVNVTQLPSGGCSLSFTQNLSDVDQGDITSVTFDGNAVPWTWTGSGVSINRNFDCNESGVIVITGTNICGDAFTCTSNTISCSNPPSCIGSSVNKTSGANSCTASPTININNVTSGDIDFVEYNTGSGWQSLGYNTSTLGNGALSIIGNVITLGCNKVGQFRAQVTNACGTQICSVSTTCMCDCSQAGLNITANPSSLAVCPSTNPPQLASSLATVNGGTAPYNIQWSNGPSCSGTSCSATFSTPGTYTVSVTDANGCTSSDTVSVTEDCPSCPSPTPPEVSLNQNSTMSISTNSITFGGLNFSGSGVTISKALIDSFFGTFVATILSQTSTSVTVSIPSAYKRCGVGLLNSVGLLIEVTDVCGDKDQSVATQAFGYNTSHDYNQSAQTITGTSISPINGFPACNGPVTWKLYDLDTCSVISSTSGSTPMDVSSLPSGKKVGLAFKCQNISLDLWSAEITI